jgi:hypothetical protein
MSRKRSARLALGAAATALCAVLPVSSASAQPLDQGHEHESSDFIDSPCGYDVRIVIESDSTFLLRTTGSTTVPVFEENLTFTVDFINLVDGRQMTQHAQFHNQDQSIDVNGDGTYTLHEKSVGPMRVTGSDGKLLFVDAAAIWFDVLIGDNGTPGDFDDDVFISQSDPIKLVGHVVLPTRDFCTDLDAQVG